MNKEQLVNKWIKELEQAGFTYDEMLEVFKLARIKHEQMLVDEFEERYNVGIVTKEFPDGRKKYRVHGHSSTESDTRLEAIDKYVD